MKTPTGSGITYANGHKFFNGLHAFETCEECAKTEYLSEPARYAKNCVAVQVLSNDGWKTHAGFVAEQVRARYSHRECAYIMRPSQFERFKALLKA